MTVAGTEDGTVCVGVDEDGIEFDDVGSPDESTPIGAEVDDSVVCPLAVTGDDVDVDCLVAGLLLFDDDEFAAAARSLLELAKIRRNDFRFDTVDPEAFESSGRSGTLPDSYPPP